MEVKELCTIIATIPTGLEKGAADECKEVLGRSNVVSERGKIVFPLHCLEELSKVCSCCSPANQPMEKRLLLLTWLLLLA